MMKSAAATTIVNTPRVAILFANRWAELAVKGALENAGMNVQRYPNALALVAALHSESIDIAVIEDHDRHMEGSMAALRFRGTTTVPIVAAGRGTSSQIAMALTLGAADYADLGESMDLLVNRVRARLQVCLQRNEPESLQIGDCVLDAHSHNLRSPCGELQLRSREFALAWLMFEHAGRVVSLHTISTRVWGRDLSVTKRTIEAHMSSLRRKLSMACEASVERLQLQAINNVGYRLVHDLIPSTQFVDSGQSRLFLDSELEPAHAN